VAFAAAPPDVGPMATVNLADPCSSPRHSPGAPPPLALLGEARALAELAEFRRQRLALIAELPRWPTRSVLVIPGFLSGDWATAPLRGVLSALGHDVSGWKLGRNLGLRDGVFEKLEHLFVRRAAEGRRPLALIGLSLGGLYATELARRWPQLTQQLITLGSPVSGHLTANNVWRYYERVAGHTIDAAPVEWEPGALPQVPFTAIQARGDGIVHPLAARAPSGPNVENVTVDGSHSGLGWNIAAVRVIADRLARN
jgi:pimeloyl-ACP methyl ester carboxylesterase